MPFSNTTLVVGRSICVSVGSVSLAKVINVVGVVEPIKVSFDTDVYGCPSSDI